MSGFRVAVLLIALAVAGCGGSPRGAASARSAPVSDAGTVTARNSALGKLLVDGSGRTLYAFSRDRNGTSSCTAACATAWPPFVTEAGANAGAGVNAAKLSTVTRPGGTHQVAYDGHPLYRFEGDASAGDVNGQDRSGFGGTWRAVAPSGNAVDR